MASSKCARRITRGQFFTSNSDVAVRLGDAVLHTLYGSLTNSNVDWASIDNQIIIPARKSDIGTTQTEQHTASTLQPRHAEEDRTPSQQVGG